MALKKTLIIFVSLVMLVVSVKVLDDWRDSSRRYYEPKVQNSGNTYLLSQSDENLKLQGLYLKGFHGAEDFGRWVSENSAVIGNLGIIEKDSSVVICGFAFVPNVGKTGILIIGDSEFDLKFMEKKSCSKFLYSGETSVNDIVVTGFSLTSPKEININNDTRKISVAIESIRITTNKE